MKRNNEKQTEERGVDLSRRKFLHSSAAALIGGAILGGIGGSIIAPRTAYATLPNYLPVPTPGTLDTNFVKKQAYNYYFTAGG